MPRSFAASSKNSRVFFGSFHPPWGLAFAKLNCNSGKVAIKACWRLELNRLNAPCPYWLGERGGGFSKSHLSRYLKHRGRGNPPWWEQEALGSCWRISPARQQCNSPRRYLACETEIGCRSGWRRIRRPGIRNRGTIRRWRSIRVFGSLPRQDKNCRPAPLALCLVLAEIFVLLGVC